MSDAQAAQPDVRAVESLGEEFHVYQYSQLPFPELLQRLGPFLGRGVAVDGQSRDAPFPEPIRNAFPVRTVHGIHDAFLSGGIRLVAIHEE